MFGHRIKNCDRKLLCLMIYTSARLGSKHKEMWRGFSVDWTGWPIFDNLDCISFGICLRQVEQNAKKKVHVPPFNGLILSIFTMWKNQWKELTLALEGSNPTPGQKNRSFWLIYTSAPRPLSLLSATTITPATLSWRSRLELSFSKNLIVEYRD